MNRPKNVSRSSGTPASKQRVNRLKEMELETNGPVTDIKGMTKEEKELFFSVVQATVAAIHGQNPVQQAVNMEAFFASSCRSALFFAGLYVREMRNLQREFDDG